MNPGKICHSNSIGSPSIVSKVLYCGESLSILLVAMHLLPLEECIDDRPQHKIVLQCKYCPISTTLINPASMQNFACDLRAPHRLTRPAFEAHPGANTFPSACGLAKDQLHGPIHFPQHLSSVHDHGRQRSDRGPQHLSCPYVGLTVH